MANPFLHLTDVIDPRVTSYAGRADYEAKVGPAPADDTTKAEKRWTGPAGIYTFVTVDPSDATKPLKVQQPMTEAQSQAVNFSGAAAYPQWSDFLAKRLSLPVDATLSNPIGKTFNLPTELPLGDFAQLFIVTQAEAKALAGELTPPATAVVIPSLDNLTIVYGPTETRRLWGVKLANGVVLEAFALLQARSNDATVDHHGGVGQPVTITYAGDGSPIYTQNLGPEPHNAIMMPTPVTIPDGYQPGFAPQTLGSGTNTELGLVLIAPVSTGTLTPEQKIDAIEAILAQ